MNILNSKRFQQAETEEGYFVLEPAFIREALEGGVEFGTVQFFVYMYMRWCEVFGKYRVLFAGKKHIAEHIGATEKEVENALDRLKRKGLVQYIDFQVNVLRAKQKFWVSTVRLSQVQQKAPTQVGGAPTQVGGAPTQVGGGLSVPPQSEDNNVRKEYKNIRKKERKKTSYDEIFDELEVSDGLKEVFLEFIKSRKLNKKIMTDRALKLAIKKVRKLAASEEEQIAIVEQSIERCWTGLFPLNQSSPSGGTSPSPSSASPLPLPVTENGVSVPQNPNVKKLFDLWEENLGLRPLENPANIQAMENLLHRFGQNASWLIGGLSRSKGDKYVPKEISLIATPADLWERADKMWSYILSHKEVWQQQDIEKQTSRVKPRYDGFD